jgi:hypothetical protein
VTSDFGSHAAHSRQRPISPDRVSYPPKNEARPSDRTEGRYDVIFSLWPDLTDPNGIDPDNPEFWTLTPFRLGEELDLRVAVAGLPVIDPAPLLVVTDEVMHTRLPEDFRPGLRKVLHIRIEKPVLPIHCPLPAALMSIHCIILSDGWPCGSRS